MGEGFAFWTVDYMHNPLVSTSLGCYPDGWRDVLVIPTPKSGKDTQNHQLTGLEALLKLYLKYFNLPLYGKIEAGLLWVSDPPENCHLNVKKLPKTYIFFKKIAKNCQFLQPCEIYYPSVLI